MLDMHPNIWLGCTGFRSAGVFPVPSSWYATDFALCLPPALGCWPSQPRNSSQAREICGCQMCWAACDFCPYTVSLWARKSNLPNICQVFADLKQPTQSSSIIQSLDICKSVYFYLHSESISTEHTWLIWYIWEMCVFLSRKNYIPGKATHPSLTTALGMPSGK